MKINIKNIKKVFAAIFLSTLMYSCTGDNDAVVFDVGEGFLQVANTAANVSEGNAEGVKIEFLYGGSSNENGINVKYTLETEDATRFTEANGGTIEIPAGSFSAEITLIPVNNLKTDGDNVVAVTLSPDNAFPVGLAGGINNVASIITIVDDDCPISINDWVGTYSVVENFTSGGNSPSGLVDFFSESYQVELSLDTNDSSGTKLIVTNSAGFNTYIVDGTILGFDTCNNNVNFDGASAVQVALWNTFSYTESTYDEEKFIIQATGPLLNFGDYQFTFTKQ